MALLPRVSRALKHHVLEQVGQPGLARRLFFQPHPVVDRHVHQGIGVILGQDHRQAIVEPILLIGHDQGIGHFFLLLDQHGAGQGQDTEEIEQTPHDSHVISQFSNLNIIMGHRCCPSLVSQQGENGDGTPWA